MNWVVPPPKIAAAVIRKMIAEKASCILVVPKWESAPYWPMLMYTNFVADQFDFKKKMNMCVQVMEEMVYSLTNEFLS